MSGWLLAVAADDKYVWGAVGAAIGAVGGAATAWIKGHADVKRVHAENKKRIDELQKEHETQLAQMREQWEHEYEEQVRESKQKEAAAKREQLKKLREAASLLANTLKDKHATGYRADLGDARKAIISARRNVEIDDRQLTELIDRLGRASDSEGEAEAAGVSAALHAYKLPDAT